MSTLAQVAEEHRGKVAVASVRGEIDASNAAWLGHKLRGMLTNESEALALDLTETTYIDSAGIALVFSLYEELGTHQQRLHLVVREGSPIARMLGLAGVDRAVDVHPTLPAALARADAA